MEEEEELNRYYTCGHYNEFPVYLSEKFNVNTVGLGTDSLHETWLFLSLLTFIRLVTFVYIITIFRTGSGFIESKTAAIIIIVVVVVVVVIIIIIIIIEHVWHDKDPLCRLAIRAEPRSTFRRPSSALLTFVPCISEIFSNETFGIRLNLLRNQVMNQSIVVVLI